jgi:putative ABC transport system substrate-binding protein
MIIVLPCPWVATPGFGQNVPVIGMLAASSPDGIKQRLPAFSQGLKDNGFVGGKNVRIENLGAGGRYDRLPALAAELVSRGVSLIATTGGNAPARAAKSATSTIPIVFTTGDDPVRAGLVASLAHPGGNATGVTLHTAEMLHKRVELLHELVPSATTIALLTGRTSRGGGARPDDGIETSDHVLGFRLIVLTVSAEDSIDSVIASAVRQGAQALLLSTTSFLLGRRKEITAAAARNALPAIYPWRQYADAGGLMSYGPDLSDAYYQIGSYAGRILKGSAPGELPVQLPTKFELVINLRAARGLNLAIPRLLNARANKVIE